MTHSPFQYAMRRGIDVDAGGAADLQTDVMRFMAILSLCLVAIFALVQSLPLDMNVVERPPLHEVMQELAEKRPAQIIEEPVRPKTVAEVEAGTPPAEIERQQPVVMPAPVPPPAPATIARNPSPARSLPASPPVQRKGFILQFENDDALTRLISRNDVGLYAITADKSLRLGIDGRRMNFWPASTPGQFHEMDKRTVPADVKRALLRSGADLEGEPKWGVTLPPRTAAQLHQFLTQAIGGSLIIGGNGELRLEP